MRNKKNSFCCGSVKVGARGQIVLPVELRKKFHIKEGEMLFVAEDGSHIKVMRFDIVKKVLKS